MPHTPILDRSGSSPGSAAGLRRSAVPLGTTLVVLVLTGAACGGSSRSSASSSASRTSSAVTSPTTSTAASSSAASRIRATLVGQNHHPRVNRSWAYTVTADAADGRPLSGTVDIEFTFAGEVVGRDTPPRHPIRHGRWHDTLKFPPEAVGKPLKVQAVIHTELGSKTLDWAIVVRP